MKIRTRLTLRYSSVTAAVFLLFVLFIYLFSERNRSHEFFRDLKKEAITKAHLFLESRVDAETMQSIYLNNREFIDEVEVAIYNTEFQLLYHDAKQIDIVKETPEMIERIVKEKSIEFYQEDYQVVGLLYPFQGNSYIITAAAYDGYGRAKQESLHAMLGVLSVFGLILVVVVGYLLSRSALSPVSDMVKKVGTITASNLGNRLVVKREQDELGELAVTFNHMLDRLEKSFEAQKMFVSNVSHELRTPMAALTAELELALLKERTPAEYKAAIQHAMEDTQQLRQLAEGLLNLAKADYLPERIAMQPVRLDELLLDARELVLKAHPTYTIELLFEQESDDDSLITVYGNSYLLTTAFLNLMENNCKFSESQTSTVQITFWEEKAIVRLSDTGIGISAEDLKQIFSPFHRGSNRQYAQGHGIGMALTHKIILLHKGKIQVDSQPNEGTTYTIELPHI